MHLEQGDPSLRGSGTPDASDHRRRLRVDHRTRTSQPIGRWSGDEGGRGVHPPRGGSNEGQFVGMGPLRALPREGRAEGSGGALGPAGSGKGGADPLRGISGFQHSQHPPPSPLLLDGKAPEISNYFLVQPILRTNQLELKNAHIKYTIPPNGSEPNCQSFPLTRLPTGRPNRRAERGGRVDAGAVRQYGGTGGAAGQLFCRVVILVAGRDPEGQAGGGRDGEGISGRGGPGLGTRALRSSAAIWKRDPKPSPSPNPLGRAGGGGPGAWASPRLRAMPWVLERMRTNPSSRPSGCRCAEMFASASRPGADRGGGVSGVASAFGWFSDTLGADPYPPPSPFSPLSPPTLWHGGERGSSRGYASVRSCRKGGGHYIQAKPVRGVPGERAPLTLPEGGLRVQVGRQEVTVILREGGRGPGGARCRRPPPAPGVCPPVDAPLGFTPPLGDETAHPPHPLGIPPHPPPLSPPCGPGGWPRR